MPIVTISGNIGCGKSTIIHELRSPSPPYSPYDGDVDLSPSSYGGGGHHHTQGFQHYVFTKYYFLSLFVLLFMELIFCRRHNPDEGGGTSNTFENLRRSMEKEEKPSLNQALERANPKLKSDTIIIIIVKIIIIVMIILTIMIMIRFLSDCFQYVAAERPSTTFVLRGLTQILAEVLHQHHHHHDCDNDDLGDDDLGEARPKIEPCGKHKLHLSRSQSCLGRS